MTLAHLSNASPAASSIVVPMISISSGESTRTICVCPPLTSRQRNGKPGWGSSRSGRSMKCERICPCRWLTSTIGMSCATESPLANDTPTSSEPSSPGPRVKAMASRSEAVRPASRSAVSTTGMMFCWWAREASSGMTPPYFMCTACEAMTFESSTLLRSTAAEVSSHEDSMPSIVMSIILFVGILSRAVFGPSGCKGTKISANPARAGRFRPNFFGSGPRWGLRPGFGRASDGASGGAATGLWTGLRAGSRAAARAGVRAPDGKIMPRAAKKRSSRAAFQPFFRIFEA